MPERWLRINRAPVGVRWLVHDVIMRACTRRLLRANRRKIIERRVLLAFSDLADRFWRA